ncbi:TIGR01627 domain-containing protein [Capilliphycus salinus ALCB114379]|uniref:TIGR01627 domain-containing protein n=1 Tax=Capilliphycus salinus TaxID=2768948 RepID=UPI0039A66293
MSEKTENRSNFSLLSLDWKAFNIIIFPNFNQPEELIINDLKEVFLKLLTCSNLSEINLVIEIGNFSEEDANIFLSSIVMQLLMEENLQVEEEPHISLIKNYSARQWSALLPCLQYRIILNYENEEIINRVAANLPTLKLDSNLSFQMESLISRPSYSPRSEIFQLVKNNPGQMSVDEYCYLTDRLSSKSPCNFLVFGVGKDSNFWLNINSGGKTVFLEDNQDWFGEITREIANIEAYLVKYNTTVQQGLNLLVQYSQGIDNLSMELPNFIDKIKWDIIFVDAPGGYAEHSPGRMKSIYMASQLATMGETDVFVHDCNRVIESLYSGYFLHNENLITQVGKLRHYRIVRSELGNYK